MNTVSIINHSGSTSLLSQIAFKDGRGYPFAFDAITPESKHWAYRLVPTHASGGLTDAQLTELLKASRVPLRADWEEQVGHALGLVTIYVRKPDGGADACQARFERGPDLTPQMSGPKVKEPEPTPEPGGFDMSL